MPSAAAASAAGGGMITASSAAREGGDGKAAMASAPMAAAHSERRLNGLRDMVISSLGRASGLTRSVGRGAALSTIAFAALHTDRYGRRPQMLRLEGHDCVNKMAPGQNVSAAIGELAETGSNEPA